MRHHDPLVTKPLQHRVVWKREVVRKIVVDLFILFIQAQECMQRLAHADAHARPRPCTEKQNRAKKLCLARASMLEPVCVNVCVCVCAKLLIFNGDLVMLTRNELEVVSVFVFVIILQALLSPRTPSIAISPIRFRHSLDVPIHEELKWAEK